MSGQQDDQSTNAELLSNIRDIFERRGIDRISTAGLIDALIEDDEAPWATWNRGKPITARQIAKRLREFKITANQTIRIEMTTAKGYRLDALSEAFERYLPAPKSLTRAQPVKDAGFSDFEAVTRSPSVTNGAGQKPSSGVACYRVTDVTGPCVQAEDSGDGAPPTNPKFAGPSKAGSVSPVPAAPRAECASSIADAAEAYSRASRGE